MLRGFPIWIGPSGVSGLRGWCNLTLKYRTMRLSDSLIRPKGSRYDWRVLDSLYRGPAEAAELSPVYILDTNEGEDGPNIPDR